MREQQRAHQIADGGDASGASSASPRRPRRSRARVRTPAILEARAPRVSGVRPTATSTRSAASVRGSAGPRTVTCAPSPRARAARSDGPSAPRRPAVENARASSRPEVDVHAGQQRRRHLDDRDLRPEAGVGVGELDADRAAADDDHRRRQARRPRAPRGSSAPRSRRPSSPGSVRSRLPVARSTCRAASRSGAAPSWATSTPPATSAPCPCTSVDLVLAGTGTRRRAPAAPPPRGCARSRARSRAAARPRRSHATRRRASRDRARRRPGSPSTGCSPSCRTRRRRARARPPPCGDRAGQRGSPRRSRPGPRRRRPGRVARSPRPPAPAAPRGARTARAGTGRPARRRRCDGRTTASRSSRWPGTTSPSRTTGTARTVPTARIAACGGFTTAAKCDTGYMPRFDTVNVPPRRSSAANFPARARSTSPRTCATSAPSGWRSQSRTTGTTRPSSVAVARPTWTVSCSTIDSPSRLAFISGTRRSATPTAFRTRCV